MRSVCILKFGTTIPEIKGHRGDFDDWIVAGMGLQAGQALVVSIPDGETIPDDHYLAGVVITGSDAMVTDNHDWSRNATKRLTNLVDGGCPILGICYGHQLLATALGGRVAYNPHGRELGTVEVEFTSAAAKDPLLQGLPNPAPVHVSHRQSVVDLPANARRLASSASIRNQAFILGECTWGVQFHPEFDAEIICAYIEKRAETLRSEGIDPDRLVASCVEAPVGETILRRFSAIVRRMCY